MTEKLIFNCTFGKDHAERATLPLVAANIAATAGERWPSPERGRHRDTSDQPAPGSPSSPLLGRRLPIQVCALSELCALWPAGGTAYN
jgi:hypothetical protein